MSKGKIYILDDDNDAEKQYRQKIEKVTAKDKCFEVRSLVADENLTGNINALEDRRRIAREVVRPDGVEPEEPPCLLDEADILVIDYDLLKLKGNPSLTGEALAYLARCYSKCGLIIGLNQFGQNAFDLTLCGHPESFADLNIGGEQIGNPGLWTAPWKDQFRPWIWPLLPRALGAFRRRAEALEQHLGDEVLPYFGFQPGLPVLPRVITQFLTKGQYPYEVKFTEFVEKSGNGLQGRDKPMDDRYVARIAAARLGKWLERLVLPCQDILVDAPHLVSRYPSLLGHRVKRKSTWDETASASLLGSVALNEEKISTFRFKKEDWLSRPAWFWNSVSTCEDIDEIKNPWEAHISPYVFCEDTSRFLSREKAAEFVADLPSQFIRRFVECVEERATYEPRVRFSL